MEWVWDEEKARANLAKHGVLFETAAAALADPLRLTRPDPHPDDDRWQTIGVAGQRTLFVVHTEEESDRIGRIISARLAGRSERRAYEAIYL